MIDIGKDLQDAFDDGYKKGKQDSWIPVSERLPKNETRVLICAKRKLCNGKVRRIITTAMYEDGTLRTDDTRNKWGYCKKGFISYGCGHISYNLWVLRCC